MVFVPVTLVVVVHMPGLVPMMLMAVTFMRVVSCHSYSLQFANSAWRIYQLREYPLSPCVSFFYFGCSQIERLPLW